MNWPHNYAIIATLWGALLLTGSSPIQDFTQSPVLKANQPHLKSFWSSPMRTYKKVDMSYFDTAPIRGTVRQSVNASAKAVFKSFEDPDSWPQYIVPITKVVWTSPKPYKKGTTRDIFMGKKKVTEYFFHWEHGKRMSFYFEKGEMLMGAFAEDYQVIEKGRDQCEVVWRYAFELPGLLKIVHPFLPGRVQKTGEGWFHTFAEYMEKNKDRYSK